MNCNNPSCNNQILNRIDGIYAFTKVTKENENIIFNPASGIPVVCFICPLCKEIKTYSAKLLEEI